MRALVLRHGELRLEDVDEPVAGPGQLLVEPIATGICGSDLSARQHTEEFLAGHRLAGADHSIFDPGRGLVMGHEFTGLVLECGEGVTDYVPGDRIVAMPYAADAAGRGHTVGYSNTFPGGLGERVVVEAFGHLRIPDGVSAVTAAVTEPMATGVNGVLRSRIEPPSGAIIVGTGPVGLGAVVELRQRGIFPIVVSEPSPVRRKAASALGADLVVDPREVDPIEAWRDIAAPNQEVVVYEASGKAGLLGALMDSVPPHTRIVVVGTCMTPESFKPLVAMLRNVAVEFVTGPRRAEAYHAMPTMFRHIERAQFDMNVVVTGVTGLEGAPALFDLLRPGDPHAIDHVKVLVRHDLIGEQIREHVSA